MKSTKKQKSSKRVKATKSAFNKSGIKRNEFPVVGIGASAGGLEALEQFFKNVPSDSGMAFIIIQHLDPTHEGIMPELIQRFTDMKVFRIEDGIKVKPNCIYVIPSNRNLSISKGTLYLFEISKQKGLRLPIDFFFRTLADDMQERSIAVILSGMGSDGTLGLRSIKEKAGLVLVQEPENAKFDGMPRSAIDEGLANIVAPANELPGKIIGINKQTPIRKPGETTEDKEKSSLEKIIIMLRAHTGNDFSNYKKNTIYRRVERRMSIHQIDKISLYVRFLQENRNELDILFKELLIGVTGFFRDAEVWNYLKEKILPSFLERTNGNKVLRAWIPGCSTGEEAYSLAIIFKEVIAKEKLHGTVSLQIFGTDLDKDAIEKSRKGIYTVNITSDVSPTRLKKFFYKEEDRYRISAEIREKIIFAVHNLLSDPPFTKLDFIFCRNLFIYLESNIQKKLMPFFHRSLNPDGILVLGNAETIGEHNHLFTPVENKLRIFRRKESVIETARLELPTSISRKTSEQPEKSLIQKPSDNLQVYVEKILLQNFSPPALLVGERGDILYISGKAGKYLELAEGKANWNIYAMVRNGLRTDLLNAFQKVVRHKNTVFLKNLNVKTNAGIQTVNVNIQYILKPEELNGYILIVFPDVPEKTKPESSGNKKSPARRTSKVFELKQELKEAAEENQLIYEEMQTSQEELNSTNEELHSTNEELQSANEELTTSKEEMQSLNEELQTVNLELQSKVDDLSRSSNDMKNLLNSTDIATIFLDNELNIRRFTTQASEIFKLKPGDIGRPITDLSTDLIYPEFINDCNNVSKKLVFSDKNISSMTGKWYNIRIMPYRTIENRINGLVITFTDISSYKEMEKDLRASVSMMRLLIKTAGSIIICLSSDGNILEFNSAAEKVLGYKRNEVLNRNYIQTLIPEVNRKKMKEDMKKMFSGEIQGKYENTVKNVENKIITIQWSVNKLYAEDGSLDGVIAIGQNIKKNEK